MAIEFARSEHEVQTPGRKPIGSVTASAPYRDGIGSSYRYARRLPAGIDATVVSEALLDLGENTIASR